MAHVWQLALFVPVHEGVAAQQQRVGRAVARTGSVGPCQEHEGGRNDRPRCLIATLPAVSNALQRHHGLTMSSDASGAAQQGADGVLPGWFMPVSIRKT